MTITKKQKNIFNQGLKNRDDKETIVISLTSAGLKLKQAGQTYDHLVSLAIVQIIAKSEYDLEKIKACRKLITVVLKKNIARDSADALKKVKYALKTVDVPHHDWLSSKPMITKAIELISKEQITDLSRSEVEKLLVQYLFVTEKEALNLWPKIRAKYGLTVKKSRASACTMELVEWFIENSDSPKDQIIDKGKEIGMTISSINNYASILLTAKAISDRMVEELEKNFC